MELDAFLFQSGDRTQVSWLPASPMQGKFVGNQNPSVTCLAWPVRGSLWQGLSSLLGTDPSLTSGLGAGLLRGLGSGTAPLVSSSGGGECQRQLAPAQSRLMLICCCIMRWSGLGLWWVGVREGSCPCLVPAMGTPPRLRSPSSPVYLCCPLSGLTPGDGFSGCWGVGVPGSSELYCLVCSGASPPGHGELAINGPH